MCGSFRALLAPIHTTLWEQKLLLAIIGSHGVESFQIACDAVSSTDYGHVGLAAMPVDQHRVPQVGRSRVITSLILAGQWACRSSQRRFVSSSLDFPMDRQLLPGHCYMSCAKGSLLMLSHLARLQPPQSSMQLWMLDWVERYSCTMCWSQSTI